jgi:hypothetical protein
VIHRDHFVLTPAAPDPPPPLTRADPTSP